MRFTSGDVIDGVELGISLKSDFDVFGSLCAKYPMMLPAARPIPAPMSAPVPVLPPFDPIAPPTMAPEVTPMPAPSSVDWRRVEQEVNERRDSVKIRCL